MLFRSYYIGRDRDGLIVERGGKRVSVRICRGPALGMNAWSTLYNAKLPTAERDFEVP